MCIFVVVQLLSCVWLRPHELQLARLPCHSLSPRICSNSCPLSQWCHPTISSSEASSSLALNLPNIRVLSSELTLYIRWRSIGASASASVIPVNIQGWFRIDWFDLLSVQGTLEESPPAPQFESINSLALSQPSLWFNSHIHTWLLEKT